MKTEINPQDTSRAQAFELWMTSPMPMVTLTKTFNVSKILKASRKSNIRFLLVFVWKLKILKKNQKLTIKKMKVIYKISRNGLFYFFLFN